MQNLGGRVGVLGAGQMGAGIAQVVAASGRGVVLVDATLERANQGKEGVASRLKSAVDKGKVTTEEREVTLERMVTSDSWDAFATCEWVVEAIPESAEIKLEAFKRLGKICPEPVILASNTSSISITQIAGVTRFPERVVGMHFMNPVPVMKLVEGIRALQTTDAVFERTRRYAEELGKVFVEARDVPGFLVNRVLMPMINEAVYALYEGIATPEGIDQAMKLGTHQPMGPLALADFIGLDTCLSIMEVLHEGLGDSKYRPCPLLRQYVLAGWLGKKTGRGFYAY